MADEEQSSQNSTKTNGYGKRPVWQWILIYLVVAIVVYGLIYFIFIRNGSGSTGY